MHFVSDAKIRNAFLGLKSLHGSHTAGRIREHVEEILDEYGLSLDRVFKIVTDNGSNMVAAFQDVLKCKFEEKTFTVFPLIERPP